MHDSRFAPGEAMRWAAVVLLGCLAPLTGCRVVRTAVPSGTPMATESISGQEASHHYKQEARHAWQEVGRQYPNRAFTASFADGFKEGFTNRRWNGTSSTTPAAPPAWYRAHAQTPESRAAGFDYLSGFQYGSDVAHSMGHTASAAEAKESTTAGSAKIFSMSQTLPSMVPAKPRAIAADVGPPKTVALSSPHRPEPLPLPRAPEPVALPATAPNAPALPPLPPMPGVPIPFSPEAPPSLPPYPSNKVSRPLVSPIIPAGGMRSLERPVPKLTFPILPVFEPPAPLPPAANPG